MTIAVQRLVPGSQLTTSALVYYTCPPATAAVVKRAVFSNTSGGAVTVTAYVVPGSGAAGVANEILPPVSIAAGATYVSPEMAGLALGPGDTLQALSNTATAVTFIASGITVV